MEIAIVVVSDRSFNGERDDVTGKVMEEYLQSRGHTTKYVLVPDEMENIESALQKLVNDKVDIAATCGGTGCAKRDVTPEATKKIIEKEIPGVAEYIRSKNFENSKNSYLSRGLCGIASESIIVNLPGSPDGALTCFKLCEKMLEHGVFLIKNEVTNCYIK